MATIRALVVDDSRLAQFALKQQLFDLGVHADAVASGEDALAYLCNQKPDVIFMDHTMPGMDGLQAVREIKNDDTTAHIPVYMYTSMEGISYETEAKAVGAVGVLPKQVKPQDLSQILREVRLLKRRREQKDNVTHIHTIPSEQDEPNKINLDAIANSYEEKAEYKALKDMMRKEVHELGEFVHEQLNQIKTTMAGELTIGEEPAQNTAPQPSRGGWIPWSITTTLTVVILLMFYHFVINQPVVNAQRGDSGTMQRKESPLEAILPSQESGEVSVEQWAYTLEWALNLDNKIPNGEYLLGDTLVIKLSKLVDLLDDAGFEGLVVLEAHLGNYCMIANSEGEWVVPDAGTPRSECEVPTMSASEAESTAEQQSVAFGNFMSSYQDDLSGDIAIEIVSKGRSDPAMPYPDSDSNTTAGQWNRVAAYNNRVEIKLLAE